MTKGSMNVSKIHDRDSSCCGKRSPERSRMLRQASKRRRVLKREDLSARADAIEEGHKQDYLDWEHLMEDNFGYCDDEIWFA